MAEWNEDNPEETVQIPIDGTLDLHTFSPKDLKYLIPDYLEECRKSKILNIRIIHGKGAGQLRRSVHALLSRHPVVLHYQLADETGGSWGATLVTLRGAAPASVQPDRNE